MTSFWANSLRRMLSDDAGATAVEYAVMIALIAGVVIGSVQGLAQATRSSFDASANALP